MPTQNVNLSPQQSKFIKSRVKQGRFRNASEVVRAGLRLLEQQDKEDRLKLEKLRQAVKKGFDELDRGDYVEIDANQIDAFMDQIDAKVRRSRKV